MPREPYEGVEIDGANRWQKFRFTTLPLIAPFMMVAVIIRSIDALKSFDIIHAMTRGGPGTASETIDIYLYCLQHAVFRAGELGPLAAAAIIVTLPVLVLTLFAQRLIIAGLTAGAVE